MTTHRGTSAPPSASFFISIIVTTPALQIINIIMGFAILALEYPLPLLKGTALHRSLALRVVLYTFNSFTNCTCMHA
jgi:hypothetical protein